MVEEKKRSDKFREEWQDCKRSGKSLRYTLLSSIDAALDGIKAYDFYYSKIYVPVWRATVYKLKCKIDDFKTERERGKNYVARSDVWGLSDSLCTYMAKALKILSDEIWGDNPDWNELPKDPHYSAELYFKIQVFLETYGRLQEAYETEFDEDTGVDWNMYVWGLQNSCYRQIKRIINEHLEMLWD